MTEVTALPTKTQEACDRFYIQNGPCCAGCDWWFHHTSLIGECHRSAPVSAEQRYSIVNMDWRFWHFRDQDAGHILTNREHHCGDFKDEFDWPSLPRAYLRQIGWDGHKARPVSTDSASGSPGSESSEPDEQTSSGESSE